MKETRKVGRGREGWAQRNRQGGFEELKQG